MDWEKECKRLMYDVLPKMAVDKEHLEAAVKKLISERDCAIKDANHLLGNECNRYFCANGEDCNTECRWRGVKR